MSTWPEASSPRFSEPWITAAAGILPAGAYLCATTGREQAARVQVCAEDASLSFVNQIVVGRKCALRTTRRFSHAHTVATVCCAGPESSIKRFFSVSDDLRKARTGTDYAVDWLDSPADMWGDVAKYERLGVVRCPTILSPALVRRLVSVFTLGPEIGGLEWQYRLADPLLGGG